MPRVNHDRTLTHERIVAERVAVERSARGWSYEKLARRMTEVGYPIHPSAVFKVERGDPPRRITVDDLVGFAAAFGVTVEYLLTPAVAQSGSVDIAVQVADARADLVAAVAKLDAVMEQALEQRAS
jgi:transcriptional regulator with XRE-family HTH domain